MRQEEGKNAGADESKIAQGDVKEEKKERDEICGEKRLERKNKKGGREIAYTHMFTPTHIHSKHVLK